MAGRESAALQYARELITKGPRAKRKNVTEACEIAGCSRYTVYHAQWYKDYKEAEAARLEKEGAK